MIRTKLEYLTAQEGPPGEARLLRIAKHLALDQEESKIDRITDKSIGLLQALALLLAGVALKPPQDPFYEKLVFALIGVAVFLLLLNLVLISSRYPADQKVDEDLQIAMMVTGYRGFCLMISIGLSLVAIPVWLGSVICGLP